MWDAIRENLGVFVLVSAAAGLLVAALLLRRHRHTGPGLCAHCRQAVGGGTARCPTCAAILPKAASAGRS